MWTREDAAMRWSGSTRRERAELGIYRHPIREHVEGSSKGSGLRRGEAVRESGA